MYSTFTVPAGRRPTTERVEKWLQERPKLDQVIVDAGRFIEETIQKAA